MPVWLRRLLGDRGRRAGAVDRAGRPADGGRAAIDEILAAAAAGDADAVAALRGVGEWLGIGLAGLVNALNPARVVFGGHLAACTRSSPRPSTRRSTPAALAAPRALVEVVPAQLGVDAAVLGAAELAFEPILADPASWFTGPVAATAPAGPLGHRKRGGTTHMSTFSRTRSGPHHTSGKGTRMHVRRSAALILGAALVLVAACGDDDDDSGAAATTAAVGASVPASTTAGSTSATTSGSTTGSTSAGTTGTATTGSGGGGDCVVGVSWNNFQEERWAKWDEPAIKEALEAGGGTLRLE